MSDPQDRPGHFQVLMTTQDGSKPGMKASLLVWFVGNINVCIALTPELDPYQRKLLMDVIRCWGRVLPHTMGSGEEPRIVMPEEAPAIRALFEDAYTTAQIVRIFRSILPHEAHNRDRDEAIIKDMRDFCNEKSDEIWRLSDIGIFEAHRWVFEQLCEHLRQLLLVVLGDRLMERFISEYDTQMRELRLMYDLASAPPQ